MFDYINHDGEITITGYTGNATEIIIPSEIEGKPVTGIGIKAFYGCSNLTSTTIPESVTSIGAWAFYGCSSLTTIKIPESTARIEVRAFYACTNLTSVTLPDSVKRIGYAAFKNCNSLKKVYYSGTEEQWEQIKIKFENLELNKAKKHFKNA